jgi:methionyl-tRNA formyltransferase
MDRGLDTGPVVKQESISFADGQGQAMIDRQCGVVGGRLLLQAIEHLSSGENATAQHGDGSYFPWPRAEDYRLNTSWPALRAYNFMRATNGTSAVYPVRFSGDDIILREAVQVQPEAEQATPVIFERATVHLQFSPGVLTAKLASSAEA